MPRLYVITFLATLLGILGGVFALNVAVDAYGVFWPADETPEVRAFEPNTRFRKIEYLSTRCHKFNAFIMGDSRSSSYLVQDVDKFFDVKSYNLSVSGESIVGVLKTLQGLARANCVPQLVVYPISTDGFGFNVADFALSHEQLLRIYHPLIDQSVTLLEKFSRYALNYSITLTSIQVLYDRLKGRPGFLIYDFATGNHQTLFARLDKIAPCPAVVTPATDRIRQWFNWLAQLQTFLGAHDIKLVLVMNPLPYPSMLSTGLAGTQILLHELSKYADGIYALSLTDPRLRQPNMFIDQVHFKPDMVRDMFQQKNFQSFDRLSKEFSEAFKACGIN